MGLRLLHLTAGTGSFYCGTCLRDGALVQGLRARGHDATMAPLYLPLILEEDVPRAQVHLGGVNAYLSERLPLRLPGFLRRWLDSPRLLSWAARRGDMTTARDLGPLTVAMLRGEHGSQRREIEGLLGWLEALERPDVVLLSNALLVGLAGPLARALERPVLCSLQGEAPFLDALPEPHRARAWETLAGGARDCAGFLAVSRYTAGLMTDRARLDPARVHVVPNGIDAREYAPARVAPATPVVGYFARLCRDKGLATAFEAFLELRRRPGHETVRFVAGGTALRSDHRLLDELRARARDAGLADAVEFHPDLSPEAKRALLARFTVFTVPATYGESFGLYLLEAWAMGLPVVQPRHGAFPELLEASGGGLLVEPDDARALADGLATLLAAPERARALGAAGRAAVLERFSAEAMAREVERICTIHAAVRAS